MTRCIIIFVYLMIFSSHMKVKGHSLRRSASWISWPLAFLFQGITDDGSSGDLPIRFRHLDTKVRLKTTGKGANGGSPSASPDTENSRSPKRSPASSRRSSPNSDQQK